MISLNKNISIVYILFLIISIPYSFSQELEYNSFYLKNTRMAIEVKKNSIDNIIVKRLKPDILTFSNQNVIYNLNFFIYFDKNKKMVTPNGIEIRVTTRSKKQISPFDLWEQPIQLVVFGLDNYTKWEKEFSFHKREIKQEVCRIKSKRPMLLLTNTNQLTNLEETKDELEVDKTQLLDSALTNINQVIAQDMCEHYRIKLELTKFITQEELNTLKKLWHDNKTGSIFYIKGMYGTIGFFYPAQILAIYEELLK